MRFPGAGGYDCWCKLCCALDSRIIRQPKEKLTEQFREQVWGFARQDFYRIAALKYQADLQEEMSRTIEIARGWPSAESLFRNKAEAWFCEKDMRLLFGRTPFEFCRRKETSHTFYNKYSREMLPR